MSLHPRLCKLIKWDVEEGYGFSLKAHKGQVGQFITEVDKNSPASLGGLKDNDFLVEVNGENILRDSHVDVVQRIKADSMRVEMLVVDNATLRYYEAKQAEIHGKLPEVKVISCPPSAPDLRSNSHARLSHSTNADQETNLDDISVIKDELDIMENYSGEATVKVTPPERIIIPEENSAIRKEPRESTIEVHTKVTTNGHSASPSPHPDDNRSNSSINGSSRDATSSQDPVKDMINLTVDEMRAKVCTGTKRNAIKNTNASFKDRTTLFEQL